MIHKPDLEIGVPVTVRINKQLVPAKYAGWSEKYNMPLVDVAGRILPRKIFTAPVSTPAATTETPTTVSGVVPWMPLNIGTRYELRAGGHTAMYNCLGQHLRDLPAPVAPGSSRAIKSIVADD